MTVEKTAALIIFCFYCVMCKFFVVPCVYFFRLSEALAIATRITTIKKRITPAHIGAVTHHQDQSMYPVSFSTKNIKNRIAGIPMPLEELSFAMCLVYRLFME